MKTTTAWILEMGPDDPVRGELVEKEFTFDEIKSDELLIEPLVGCWEANMAHAINRSPVDIAKQRGEAQIVLGNAAICRVAEIGSDVTSHQVGDEVFFGCVGQPDRYGYVELVAAYDAPGSIGVLAKQTKIKAIYAPLVPAGSRFSHGQWSSYTRYWSAWSNHHVAMTCLRSQLSAEDLPRPNVWSWGGGVGMAQMELARNEGCQTAMIASSDTRLAEIEAAGIRAIDRREFPDLSFDPWRVGDADYKESYRRSERKFLEVVDKVTGGEGVHIFVENIGTPVYRATLRALARQGVIATCGWKEGMLTNNIRALECISRHVHVHTHAVRMAESLKAIEYQERNGWISPEPQRVWDWTEIPLLSDAYLAGEIDSYYPVYEVQK